MSLPLFVFPIAVLSQYFFGITLFLLSVFLVLLILVQQGRGGGLTGALGGPGGQSAFGTKAGDVFTKITIITASIWIVLSAITVRFYTQPSASSALTNTTVNQTSAPLNVTVPPPGMDNLNPSAPSESMEAAPGTSGAVAPPTTPSKETSATPTTKAEVDPKTEAPLTFDTPAATPESTPAPQESTPPAQTPSTDGAAEQPKP